MTQTDINKKYYEKNIWINKITNKRGLTVYESRHHDFWIRCHPID